MSDDFHRWRPYTASLQEETADDYTLVRAESHLAYIEREPADWWDDEHVLDNGQSAVIIRHLMTDLRDQRTANETLRRMDDDLMARVSGALRFLNGHGTQEVQ